MFVAALLSSDVETSLIDKDGGSSSSVMVNVPVESLIVALEAFDKAMNSADKSERKSLEEKHANNCRTLMRNLSKQEYHKQFDGPIEFVVMFIGSEPAYQMALKHLRKFSVRL